MSAILNAQKGRASIRGPDDVKNEIGACFYWKRACNGEFRVNPRISGKLQELGEIVCVMVGHVISLHVVMSGRKPMTC